jgi:hypothetical protein
MGRLFRHLMMVIGTAPLMAVAVIASPVNAAQSLKFEPQLVTASTHTEALPQALPTRDVRQALAPGVGSEKGLQVETIRLKRAISARFPQIRDIGGWRPDSMRWHPNGLAIDVIIPNWETRAGRELGDRIAKFALDNAERFDLEHVIWQRIYHPADGSPKLMADLGDPDSNHYTHVHIATYGGGFPKGGETYFD